MMLGKYLNKGLGAKDQDKDSIADCGNWSLDISKIQMEMMILMLCRILMNL